MKSFRKILLSLVILTTLTSVISCSKTSANDEILKALKSDSIVTDANIEVLENQIKMDITVKDDIQPSEAVRVIKPYIKDIKTKNNDKEIFVKLLKQNGEMFGNMYF